MRNAISLTLGTALLLAGCGGPATQPTLPTAAAQRRHQQPRTGFAYSIVYRFKGPNGADGQNPTAVPIELDGTLYGTTNAGGKDYSFGSVYAYNLAGKNERLLHTFVGSDGSRPFYRLVAHAGMLYGVTPEGGTSNKGTAFEVSPSGAFRSIYSFGAAESWPSSPLVPLGGALYGTTVSKLDPFAGGTLYRLDPAGPGTPSFVRRFTKPQAFKPSGEMLAVNGKLVATSEGGGTSDVGTVWSYEPTLTGYQTVASMSKLPGPAWPESGLVALGTSYYGTAQRGGANGRGALFEVDAGGNVRVLYNFKTDDCASPYGRLAVLRGNLYGTCSGGGPGDYGGVFEYDPATKTFATIYNFSAGYADGRMPLGGLMAVGDALYGTAKYGPKTRTDTDGYGIIFELRPKT